MTAPQNIRIWPELQALMPPLSLAQKEALRRSIGQHGVIIPVVVLADGRILDGANRWEITGGDCPVLQKDVPEEKALALGMALNMVRRQLSKEQLLDMQETLRKDKELQRKTALEIRKQGKTQAEAAAAVGVSQPTIAAWEEEATNIDSDNSCIIDPAYFTDNRRKIPQAENEKIYRRIQDGEVQEQVAADYEVTRQAISKIVKKVGKEEEEVKQRKARAKKAAKLQLEGFHVGDFREIAKTIPDNSVDLIFTDPPYLRENLPLYGELGEIAARILQPGGNLICYLGQFMLPDVLDLLRPHLRYWWPLAVIHTGNLARMREYGIVVHWKPLLWFVKGSRSHKTFIDDAVFSSQEKDIHEWQQSLIEAKYYIGNLTPEKGLVFDPFCGGGTTARACKELGLRCITCDIDQDALSLAKERYVA